MKQLHRSLLALLVVGALPLFACTKVEEATYKPEPRFEKEKVEGQSISRIRLVQGAHDRIGIKTTQVRELPRFGGETERLVVDYAAVVYEPKGDTSVYTNPAPLLYVRHPIKVEYIQGDTAVLLEGPPAGTQVVTAGGAELLGMEFGVGK